MSERQTSVSKQLACDFAISHSRFKYIMAYKMSGHSLINKINNKTTNNKVSAYQYRRFTDHKANVTHSRKQHRKDVLVIRMLLYTINLPWKKTRRDMTYNTLR